MVETVAIKTLHDLTERRGTTLDHLMHKLDNYVYGLGGQGCMLMRPSWKEAVNEIAVDSP